MLFNALRGKLDATFVPGLPIAKELFPVMKLAEDRQIALWEALYDQAKLYICDRSPLVTHNAYSMVYGRRLVSSKLLQRETVVVYLYVPEAELKRRYSEVGDEHFNSKNYTAMHAAYNHVLRGFRHIVLDGTLPTEDLVTLTLQFVEGGCRDVLELPRRS